MSCFKQWIKPVTKTNAAGYASTFVRNLDHQSPGHQQGGRGKNSRGGQGRRDNDRQQQQKQASGNESQEQLETGEKGSANTPKKEIGCFSCGMKNHYVHNSPHRQEDTEGRAY